MRSLWKRSYSLLKLKGFPKKGKSQLKKEDFKVRQTTRRSSTLLPKHLGSVILIPIQNKPATKKSRKVQRKKFRRKLISSTLFKGQALKLGCFISTRIIKKQRRGVIKSKKK